MTWKSRLLSVFPLVHVLLILGSIAGVFLRPGVLSCFAIPASVYVFPVVAFRLHNLLFPLKTGTRDLGKREYSSWWGGHQIQLLFLAVPPLEAVLTLVPGLFSLWLRAWGSKVGRHVYWTPQVQILDRSLLEVGSGVHFGHKVITSSHVVTRTKSGRLLLMVDRITIGDNAFIGAGTRIGPGVTVGEGAVVAAASEMGAKSVDLYPRATVPAA
jgi:acetyltransferase-like isoleucine patch superfamily enzyme